MTLPLVLASGRRPGRWLVAAMWIALTVAIVVAARHLPWSRALDLLTRISAAWVAVAVLANFVILPLWAAEWRLLAPATSNVGFRGMWEVVTVSAAVLNTVPFLAGEATAVGLLVQRAGVTAGAALSVLALDQLAVAFAKLMVIGAAAMVAPLPEWLRAGVLSLGVAFVALLTLLTVLAHGSRSSPLDHVSDRRRSIMGRLRRWGTHLEALRDPGRAGRVVILAVMKKGAELAAIVAIQLAFGRDPSLTSALLVLAALAITTLVPVAPANLGVYEGTVYAVYRYVGVTSEVALGLALVQHLCFLVPPVCAGYATLTWRQLTSRPRAG